MIGVVCGVVDGAISVCVVDVCDVAVVNGGGGVVDMGCRLCW